MKSLSHPYKILKLDYIYVLTVIENTLVIDGLGYHKARAIKFFKEIICPLGCSSYSSYLLRRDRKLIVWSKNNSICKEEFTIKVNSPFEPDKHPHRFERIIKKNEVFDWHYFTRYYCQIPTEEKIRTLQKRGHWYTKHNPVFYFFHSAKEVQIDSMEVYFPKWLSEFQLNHSFRGVNYDNKPLDESKLLGYGIRLKRSYQRDISPYRSLTRIGKSQNYSFKHLKKDYSCSKYVFKAKKMSEEAEGIKITIGFSFPPEKVWLGNIK